MNEQAFFESFNARNLAPAQVAESFVPSRHFDELIGQHHTLILGPRGSGKTTLLKMLQPEALDSWHAPLAESYRRRIGFISVFVATDVSWGEQISLLGEGIIASDHRTVLAVASFTTQIFRRLTEVMMYLISRPSDGVGKWQIAAEESLAAELARTFKLSGTFYTLFAVRNELSRRLADLHAIASVNSITAKDTARRLIEADASLHLSFLPCCAAAIDAFNDLAGRPHQRWAFLFDELELAPRPVRDYLVRAFRSVDERLLFKLSLVPSGDYFPQFSSHLAQAGQDYEVISLWYARKDEGSIFCRALWDGGFRARGADAPEPEAVLGHSVFDLGSRDWQSESTAYRPGSKVFGRFESLARKDPTFAEFLRKEGIKLSQLHKLPANQRAETVRKATSTVALRDAFIKEPSGRQQLRSRKTLNIYTGADALFAMTEGNPRIFKALVAPLILMAIDGGKTVPPAIQAKQVDHAIRRFRALLRAIPARHTTGGKAPRGLLSLLDQIGEFFFQKLIRDPFNLDPPGTFIVDSWASESLVAALGDAMNAGAIVCLDDMAAERGSIRGKRFRLSYLLAPYYRISLRIERSISLSGILMTDSAPRHPSLFSEGEGE